MIKVIIGKTNFEIKNNEEIIGLVLESKTDYRLVLKNQIHEGKKR